MPLGRRQFLGLAAGLALAEEKPKDESVTGSATRDVVARTGLVLSSFTGSEEMDGTKLRGLAKPSPVDAELTDAQLDALVLKALELGQMRRGSRGGGSRRRSAASEDWVVFLVRGADGPPGSGTDPRVVRSVLRAYVERGSGKRYTIARGSSTKLSGFTGEWRKLTAEMRKLAPAARFELLDLNEDEWLEAPTFDRQMASRNPSGLYAVSKTIRQCDMVVSIAPLATDPLTGVALTTSNYFGIVPGSVYGYPKEKLLDLGAPEDVLMDLYMHQPPRFAVAGGALALEGEGDKPVRHNVVIAGYSNTAVDTVAASVMGFDAEKLPVLDKLVKRGFGVNDVYSIWTRGNEVEEARRPFKKPAGWEKS